MAVCYYQVFLINKILFFFVLGTIVFSIHQPRHSIFQLFDTVLLMLNGHTVYLGQSISMTSYFIELGYNYQTQDNPADFALDILNQKLNIPTFEYNFFENNNYLSNETVFIENASRSFLVDFLYVSQRTLRNSLRNSALLAWQTVVAVILGILTGLLYYQIPRTTDLGIDNRLGAIFFIIVNQIFSTTTALEPFIKERNLFIHVRKFKILYVECIMILIFRRISADIIL